MKRIIILGLILISLSYFIKIPRYKELNNLKIIDKIIVECDYVKLREVIPKRDDNGIEFEYKYHKVDSINRNKYYVDKAEVIDKCK